MKYCIMLLRCEVVNLKGGLTFSACVCVCFMLVILTICSLRNRTCFTFFRSILSQFSEEQMSRYESFRRSGFQKANMKRVCSIFLSLLEKYTSEYAHLSLQRQTEIVGLSGLQR